MKKTTLIFTMSLLFMVSSLFAQEVPTGVTDAFKRGNSQELSRYFGDKVTLIILNRTQNVDKRTAQTTLNTFFTENKVTNFSVNHEGKRDESSFIIGTLTTEKGNYRINCFLKKNENNYFIHQIRIDKANEQ